MQRLRELREIYKEASQAAESRFPEVELKNEDDSRKDEQNAFCRSLLTLASMAQRMTDEELREWSDTVYEQARKCDGSIYDVEDCLLVLLKSEATLRQFNLKD